VRSTYCSRIFTGACSRCLASLVYTTRAATHTKHKHNASNPLISAQERSAARIPLEKNDFASSAHNYLLQQWYSCLCMYNFAASGDQAAACQALHNPTRHPSQPQATWCPSQSVIQSWTRSQTGIMSTARLSPCMNTCSGGFSQHSICVTPIVQRAQCDCAFTPTLTKHCPPHPPTQATQLGAWRLAPSCCTACKLPTSCCMQWACALQPLLEPPPP